MRIYLVVLLPLLLGTVHSREGMNPQDDWSEYGFEVPTVKPELNKDASDAAQSYVHFKEAKRWSSEEARIKLAAVQMKLSAGTQKYLTSGDKQLKRERARQRTFEDNDSKLESYEMRDELVKEAGAGRMVYTCMVIGKKLSRDGDGWALKDRKKAYRVVLVKIMGKWRIIAAR